VRKGSTKSSRKGFHTTHRTKITAAARMKHLIESGKMKLHSKVLISELKGYVATGVSFNAKPGLQDDLVAALLLIVRMSQILAEWDARVFEAFSTSEDGYEEENFLAPMPIFVSSTYGH
jgi:hypothetical protein